MTERCTSLGLLVVFQTNDKGGGDVEPTATAIPPGIAGRQAISAVSILAMVVTENRTPEPTAHCLAMGGSPLPVTSRAVKIQTKAVGTWKRSPGISYTLQAVSRRLGRVPKAGGHNGLYVELVYEGAHDGAHGCAYDLAPKLGLRRGAEEVASF